MKVPEEFKLFEQVLHWYARKDPCQTLSICLMHLKKLAFFSSNEQQLNDWLSRVIKLPFEEFVDELKREIKRMKKE